jgi:hypothetical protein
MESAHCLAVVCRSKQIVREHGLAAEDEILGYLCRLADIDGSWWKLLESQQVHEAGVVFQLGNFSDAHGEFIQIYTIVYT